jgi:hypothetical protein
VAADLSVTGSGTTVISANTAPGTTLVTLINAEATMTADLPTGAFTTPVAFSVIRIDPLTLAPEPGFDASAAPAVIDPVSAHQFSFAVPPLPKGVFSGSFGTARERRSACTPFVRHSAAWSASDNSSVMRRSVVIARDRKRRSWRRPFVIPPPRFRGEEKLRRTHDSRRVPPRPGVRGEWQVGR